MVAARLGLHEATLCPSHPVGPQGFQQKFTFHSKEIVAISCSWCKQAVSGLCESALGFRWVPSLIPAQLSLANAVFQYHSKVSCFMLQQIEEPCSLGVHAAVVIPPTWILRARRPQVSLSFTLIISARGD